MMVGKGGWGGLECANIPHKQTHRVSLRVVLITLQTGSLGCVVCAYMFTYGSAYVQHAL